MAGTLEDIMQLELKQLNENSKSMTTDIKQIKDILNAQYDYTVDAAENKEAFVRNEKQLAEQRAEARENFIQEENRKAQEETQKKLDELTQTTKQTNKSAGDNGKIANSYLETLSRMTRENLEMQKRKKDDSILGKLSANLDALGKQPYGRQSDFTDFAVKNTAQIASGIKGVFGDLWNIGKKAMPSERRQKSIEKDTTAINRLQMQKTTREQEAETLEAAGETEKAESMRKTIEDLQAQIDKKAKSLSTATSKEYMTQLKKSDKEFKKIDSGDQELMMKQMREKMFTSITGKVPMMGTDRDDVQLNSQPSDKELADIESRHSKEDVGNLEEKNAKILLSTPIASSGEPSNLGQYIAGIYKKLSSIEFYIKNKSLSGAGGGEGGEGGGLLDSLGDLASIVDLIPGKGRLGRRIGKMGRGAWKFLKGSGSKILKMGKGLLGFGAAGAAGAEVLGGAGEVAAGAGEAAEAAGGAARTAEAAAEGGSKFGRALGAGGKVVGKIAAPLMAAYDLYKGSTGSEEDVSKTLGYKPGMDIGLAERSQAGITSMLSGISLGTLSSQSINKTLTGVGEGDLGGMWKGMKGLGGDVVTAPTRLLEMFGLQEEGTADAFRRETGLTADDNILNPESAKPSQPVVGPQSSVVMPEQRQVAMMTPTSPDKTTEKDIAAYQIQAQLIADAIAKRNMQTDVRQEMMIPVKANQGFFSSILG